MKKWHLFTAIILAFILLFAVGCIDTSTARDAVSVSVADESLNGKEEKAAKESAEKASKEAAEKASKEAAEKASKEAAEKASKEAAEKASKEAAEKASKEAAEQASREAAEQASREAAEQASREAEQAAQVSRAAAEQAAAAQQAASTAYNYIANMNPDSMKFHYPNCPSVKRMNESNKMYFSGTRDELINMGYKPCKNCNP